MHAAPDARNHFRAQHDVGVQLLPAQIQEAIAQSLLFRNVLAAGDLKRQRLGGRQHVDLVDDDLELAGRQRRIDVLVRAGDDTAGDGNHAFEPGRFGDRERARVRREHTLRDAVVIAQVDEQQLSVIPLAVHPSCETDGLSYVLFPEHPAVVCAVRFGSLIAHL